MYVVVSTVRSKGKVYRYAKLIENYRRPEDGRPTHRTIANLGALSDLEIDNLKVALEASRKNKKTVVATVPRTSDKSTLKPSANLRFLDVAVLLELWRRWGLDKIFDDLIPCGQTEVPPSAVIVGLVIERCVDPHSTFHAERWFPKTALPELLGVSPTSFNNTRLHRVLDELDQVGYELATKLPRLCENREGAFAALFLDVTDTWFVGHGPKIAERAKTKEGFVQRKVGIVLLCNEHGYPLRWEVIRGKESDKESMTRMIRSIRGLSWLGNAPVICDRAMGNTAHIRMLLDSKMHFLTAMCREEFSAYTDAIPHEPLTNFPLERWKSKKEMKQLAAQAGELVEAAGMEKINDKLYVLDLGIVERSTLGTTSGKKAAHKKIDITMEAMELGRRMRELVAEGQVNSQAAAGRRFGFGKSLTHKYWRLAKLGEDIQLAVLEGKAKGVKIAELLRLEKYTDLDEQYQAFEKLVKAAAHREIKPGSNNYFSKANAQNGQESIRVRAVTYFNSEMFVEQRRTAKQRLAEIGTFVESLNRRLAGPRSKMTKDKILAEVNQKLRRYELVEAYKVSVTKKQETSGTCTKYVVKLVLDDDEWKRRRRYDGFSLLVAHPNEQRSGVELCKLYREKDTVEKDFETIKSFVKLRPIHHRLDAKVRAHVTICMLALLLERTLERAANNSAQAIFEELRDCHLNLYRSSSPLMSDAYTITELTKFQDFILRSLKMRQLGDDMELMDRITPRKQLL